MRKDNSVAVMVPRNTTPRKIACLKVLDNNAICELNYEAVEKTRWHANRHYLIYPECCFQKPLFDSEEPCAIRTQAPLSSSTRYEP